MSSDAKVKESIQKKLLKLRDDVRELATSITERSRDVAASAAYPKDFYGVRNRLFELDEASRALRAKLIEIESLRSIYYENFEPGDKEPI